MSAHIVRKVWFRSVRKLRILRSSAIKWLCYAALIPCFCASFHVECHTCAICAFMAKSCSKCRFCRAWLSAELLFQVLGAVSSSASAKYCPSHLGRYIVLISARKMFPVFVRLWVYVAETLTRCVRKSGGLEQRIFVLVSHKIGWFMTRIHGQYRLAWMERLDASDFICESVLQNSYFIVTKMVPKLLQKWSTYFNAPKM